MSKATPPKAKPAVRTGPGFVAMMRGDDILDLIEEAPLAFTLAAVIALRARFTSGQNLKGLGPGEAFLGDYQRCGLSRQQYRTALAQLVKWHFVTIRATTKGTVAKLTDTRLFDVLFSGGNQRDNQRLTNDQPTPNQRPTTNVQCNTEDNGTLEQGNTGEETVVLQTTTFFPNSIQEVVAFALTRIQFPTSKVKSFVAATDWNRSAKHILDDLRQDEVRECVSGAFRFVHFNNKQNWRLDKSWQSAYLGFVESCESGHGLAEVPAKWRPHIDGGPLPETANQPLQMFSALRQSLGQAETDA